MRRRSSPRPRPSLGQGRRSSASPGIGRQSNHAPRPRSLTVGLDRYVISDWLRGSTRVFRGGRRKPRHAVRLVRRVEPDLPRSRSARAACDLRPCRSSRPLAARGAVLPSPAVAGGYRSRGGVSHGSVRDRKLPAPAGAGASRNPDRVAQCAGDRSAGTRLDRSPVCFHPARARFRVAMPDRSAIQGRNGRSRRNRPPSNRP